MTEKQTPETKVSLELRNIMDDLLKRVNEVAGTDMNISLFVYHTEPGSRINYISNTERENVIQMLKSMIKGWEDGMPDIPAHKID